MEMARIPAARPPNHAGRDRDRRVAPTIDSVSNARSISEIQIAASND